MGEEAEFAGGGDFGVELFECSGACVAWVFEELVACCFAFFVDACELGERDIDLASDFEDFGYVVALECEGD